MPDAAVIRLVESGGQCPPYPDLIMTISPRRGTVGGCHCRRATRPDRRTPRGVGSTTSSLVARGKPRVPDNGVRSGCDRLRCMNIAPPFCDTAVAAERGDRGPTRNCGKGEQDPAGRYEPPNTANRKQDQELGRHRNTQDAAEDDRIQPSVPGLPFGHVNLLGLASRRSEWLQALTALLAVVAIPVEGT